MTGRPAAPAGAERPRDDCRIIPTRNITVCALTTSPLTVGAAASSYNAVLTNGKAQAGGVLVRTATLTPRKSAS